MSITSLLTAGGLAVGVSSMAKSAIKYAIGGNLSGQKIFRSALKKYGWGTGFIPGYGVLKAMGNIPSAAAGYFGARGAFAKTLGAIKPSTGAEWYSSELTSGIKKPLYKMLKDNMSVGMSPKRRQVYSATMDVVRGYGDILGGSKAIPSNVVPDLLKTAMGTYGLTEKAGVNLTSATEAAIGGSMKALNQAHASKRLIGPTLMSNMAVVGLPALTSGVSTYAIVNAMRQKARNRLRGYE